jgi:DNA-binding PadR family transcriptional regulator
MTRRSPVQRDPRSFLPLTPRVLHVLLALSDGPLHGYGVILAVQSLTDGLIVLRTGTLYVLIRRLLTQKLIEASDDRPGPEDDDERRKYYSLTELGRAVLQAESRRLATVIEAARSRKLLGRAR